MLYTVCLFPDPCKCNGISGVYLVPIKYYNGYIGGIATPLHHNKIHGTRNIPLKGFIYYTYTVSVHSWCQRVQVQVNILAKIIYFEYLLTESEK